MDWSDVASHLTGIAHLATVTSGGDPHVSRVAPAIDGDTVWIATRATSAKARNVSAKPRAVVMWAPGAEAYVWADVDVVHDTPTKQRIWDSGVFSMPLAALFGSPDRDDFVLLRLTPTAATVIVQSESGLRRNVWRADRPV